MQCNSVAYRWASSWSNLAQAVNSGSINRTEGTGNIHLYKTVSNDKKLKTSYVKNVVKIFVS